MLCRAPKGIVWVWGLFGVFFCREKVFLFYSAKIPFNSYSAVPKQG